MAGQSQYMQGFVRKLGWHIELGPSAKDSDSLEPFSVLHSKLKFEW